MLAPDWTWPSAVPLVLAAVALLWVPGAALAAGLGAGRWPAVALGPLMTTGLVSVGGIITPFLGLRWTRPVAVAWLLLPPLLAWGVRLLLPRLGVLRRHAGARPRSDARPRVGVESRNGVESRVGAAQQVGARSRGAARPWSLAAPPVRWWEVAAGCVVAVLVAVRVFRSATVRPGNIPQQSDQIYHLGLVRWMLDNGNISSLTADGFNFPDEPRFYPAAFHDLAATLVQFTGAPVVVAENVLLLVACALVYPLAMMFLLNTLFPGRRGLVALAGALALAFTGSPWKVMVWGAVWAQAFGTVFIPAVVGVYGWGLHQMFTRQHWGSAALLLAVGLPAITLAHPSALFGAAAGCLVLSVAFALRHALAGPRDVRRWLPVAGFLALAVLGPVAATGWAPRGLSLPGDRSLSLTRTVIGVLTFWGESHLATQIASAGLFLFALIGMVVCVRGSRRGDWWLAATGVIFIVLGSLLDAHGTAWVWPWTWPWYNWAFRVQGVTDVYALALVAIGAAALLGRASRLRRAVRPAAGPVGPVAGPGVRAVADPVGPATPTGVGPAAQHAIGPAAGPVAGLLSGLAAGLVLAGVLAIVVVQSKAAIRLVGPLYKLSGTAAWITTDKAEALTELSRRMPADAVVAANPWRGGQFLYLLGPQRTAIPTEKTYGDDVGLISHGLADVMSDPAVCAAVERQGVTYVITGGNMTAGNEQWYGKYAAVDEVSTAGGFRVVAHVDPYTLWSVPACPAR
ncbi:DUF6541 family protein [Raineyella sp.]|uniref:DUF6541 family protein n=1 Tax=Raineyella sp. TaxID=1911550 RepID=UPI002B220EF6|nr:DUF6541 family protein [Raineyella sp.]MEA5153955.1 DUF6541 family protein [Raineyella sp.]